MRHTMILSHHRNEFRGSSAKAIFPLATVPHCFGNRITQSKGDKIGHSILSPVRQIARVYAHCLEFVEGYKRRTNEVHDTQRNLFRSPFDG